MQHKKTKTLFFNNSYIDKREVKLEMTTYQNNNALAVLLKSKPDTDTVQYYGLTPKQASMFSEDFAVVTVNLNESVFLHKDTAFVDENNLEGVGDWLVENNIAKPTRITAKSGFCTYRAYKFNL